MVKVKYRGRLGNQLFQYSLGRILAEELRLPMKAGKISEFPTVGSVGSRVEWWLSILGKRQVLKGHVIDLDALLAGGSGQRIILDGFFQRYEYFRAYKEVLQKEWLPMVKRDEVSENELSIHVRSGDLWSENNPGPIHPDYPGLPFSYYQKIIEEGEWEKIHVITESKNDPTVLKLSRQFGALIRSDSAKEDFNFLRSSKNIVLSVSTFAWWAAWLSHAARIYFPVAGIWDPNVRPDVDLRVCDEKRYIFRYPKFRGPWLGSQAEREWLLNH